MNRRDLLKGVSAAAVGAGVLSIPNSLQGGKRPDPKYHITLEAGGIVPFSVDPQAPRWIVSPAPLNMPPEVVAGLVSGALRIHNLNRIVNDLLHVEVLLQTGPSSPAEGVPVMPISIFNVEIHESKCKQLTVEGVLRQHFATMGEVVSTPWESPFGDIVGRTMCFSGEFIGEPDGQTEGDFAFLGGFVTGSHSTWAPAARGHLLVETH